MDDAKAKRLKAALRENLKRRKAQARGQVNGRESEAATPAPVSADLYTDPDPDSKGGTG